MAKRPPNSYTVRDAEFRFVTVFDPQSGSYVRTGVLDEAGRDSGVDPFMASFPHILDVGIMGHCLHGLSGKCLEAGNQCYQSGPVKSAPNMPFADYRKIVDQCARKTHQFALGGRGDPEMHEDFAAILDYTRQKGIVPNLTTSGFGLTEEKALLMREYCGAVAVSWYRTDYTRRALELLTGLGVRTNIHFVLSNDSIDEATDLVAHGFLDGRLPEGVNRLVFLLFKPIGLGESRRVLRTGDPRVERLFTMLSKPDAINRVGYDSCSIPALVNYAPGIDPRSYDTCEGGRFSAYIGSDLTFTPCSFDQDLAYGQSIKEMSIAEAWRSPAFERFRSRLAGACPGCPSRTSCMGGCPLVPEIVLCSREERQIPNPDWSEQREVPV